METEPKLNICNNQEDFQASGSRELRGSSLSSSNMSQFVRAGGGHLKPFFGRLAFSFIQ